MVLLFITQTQTYALTHTGPELLSAQTQRSNGFNILRKNDFLPRILCSDKLAIYMKEIKQFFQTKNWENLFPAPPFLESYFRKYSSKIRM